MWAVIRSILDTFFYRVPFFADCLGFPFAPSTKTFNFKKNSRNHSPFSQNSPFKIKTKFLVQNGENLDLELGTLGYEVSKKMNVCISLNRL